MASHNKDIHAVTFKVSKTKANARPSHHTKTTTLQSIIQKESWMVPQAKIIHQSNHDEQYTYEVEQGFLASIYLAYAEHHHLVISPDDLWLTILFSFCDYMTYHAEDMRNVFVSHEGKQQLIIDTIGSFAEQKWEQLFQQFEDKLSNTIKPDHREWIIPNFSTSTTLTRAIAQVIFMGINKEYFSYGIMTRCGIPDVTLQGTPEDWYNLQSKIKRLGQLGEFEDLAHWSTILQTIVSKMIDSYDGDVDAEWWNKCIHHHGGSGTDDFSGWVLAFFPFNKGKWQLNSLESIQSTGKYGRVAISKLKAYNAVHVPVKYNELGVMHDIMFYANSQTLNITDQKVQTAFNYAIIEMPEGTITEPYDWNDTSVKKVETINHNSHRHPLIKTLHQGLHSCDICRTSIDKLNPCYYCQSCDFDLCIRCFK